MIVKLLDIKKNSYKIMKENFRKKLSLSRDNFVKIKSEFDELKKKDFEKIFLIIKNFWPQIKIEKLYEIDQKIEVLDSNSQNYFLKTENNNSFLLKRLNSQIDLNIFFKQFLIQDWCSEKINCIPKIIKNNKNEIISVSNSSGWIIMDYIDGEFFSGKINQVYQCGKLIGQLHQCLKYLPLSMYPFEKRNKYFTAQEQLIFQNLISNEKFWIKYFDDYFIQTFKKSKSILLKIWTNIIEDNRLVNLKTQVIHYDLHPLNMIFSKHKNVIIDYGSINIATVEQALGFNLIKLSKRTLLNYPSEDWPNVLHNVKKEWLSGLNDSLDHNLCFEDMLLLGQAETFRRFLSMVNKFIKQKSSVFNGPLIHLECLMLSEELRK